MTIVFEKDGEHFLLRTSKVGHYDEHPTTLEELGIVEQRFGFSSAEGLRQTIRNLEQALEDSAKREASLNTDVHRLTKLAAEAEVTRATEALVHNTEISKLKNRLSDTEAQLAKAEARVQELEVQPVPCSACSPRIDNEWATGDSDLYEQWKVVRVESDPGRITLQVQGASFVATWSFLRQLSETGTPVFISPTKHSPRGSKALDMVFSQTDSRSDLPAAAELILRQGVAKDLDVPRSQMLVATGIRVALNWLQASIDAYRGHTTRGATASSEEK